MAGVRNKDKAVDMNHVKPLSDLKRHEEGRIAAIKVETPEELRDLMRAGALPGARVCVMHADSRHVLFFAQDTELAVDRKTASGILVQTASMTGVQSVS
jgi:Fe2+ transport system protein FeoA